MKSKIKKNKKPFEPPTCLLNVMAGESFFFQQVGQMIKSQQVSTNSWSKVNTVGKVETRVHITVQSLGRKFCIRPQLHHCCEYNIMCCYDDHVLIYLSIKQNGIYTNQTFFFTFMWKCKVMESNQEHLSYVFKCNFKVLVSYYHFKYLTLKLHYLLVYLTLYYIYAVTLVESHFTDYAVR